MPYTQKTQLLPPKQKTLVEYSGIHAGDMNDSLFGSKFLQNGTDKFLHLEIIKLWNFPIPPSH